MPGRDFKKAIQWFDKFVWSSKFDYRILTKDEKLSLERQIRDITFILDAERKALETSHLDRTIAFSGSGCSILGPLGLLSGFPIVVSSILTIIGAGATGIQYYRGRAKESDIALLEKLEHDLADFSIKIDQAMLLNS